MAILTMFQQVDMTLLPREMLKTGGITTTAGSELWFGNIFGNYANYIALTGTVVLDTGFVASVDIRAISLDFGDNTYATNMVIEDLTFFIDFMYYNGVINEGNIAQLVADVLTGNDSLRGSMFDDRIYGYDGNDQIRGGDGNDTLVGGLGRDLMFGEEGDDTIYGGKGRDTLSGGMGQDTLTGNLSADTFRFDTVAETAAGLPDLIDDFSRGQGDVIDLSRIDANINVRGNQAFEFIGTGVFTGNAGDAESRGELRFLKTAAGVTLYGDVDQDGVADIEIALTALAAAKLEDFVL